MDKTEELEKLALQVEGETLSEKQKQEIVSRFSFFISKNVKDDKDMVSIRDKFFAEYREQLHLSQTMLIYLWDEAAGKARREQGIWGKINPVLKQSLVDVRASEELGKWQFTIVKATRINDLLRLTLQLTDGALVPMTMEIKDLYNQQRFREQYTVSVGRILERIKPKTFDAFICGLEIETTMDTGTTINEMLSDVLLRVSSRMLETKTEEEAQEALRLKGFCKRDGALHFKIAKLRSEFELKGLKPERLAQSLEDLGATRIAKGIWAWKKD